MAAHSVQAAAAVTVNAAGRDAQPCADLSSWPGWLLVEQGNELLALWRQLGESHAQRAVPLGTEHVRPPAPWCRAPADLLPAAGARECTVPLRNAAPGCIPAWWWRRSR